MMKLVYSIETDEYIFEQWTDDNLYKGAESKGE
jgi:hypothetical protein